MAIDSKNQLVWVKAMARGQALPLDASEVWESKTDAETYAAGIANSSSVAYVGQTLKVIENGEVNVYIIGDATGALIRLADAATVDAAIDAIPEVESIPDSDIIALFST
jgi:hypothetical protein